MNSPHPRTELAGLFYFALVFTAGFVLGTIRQLWVLPALGMRFAELVEMPFMLIVIILSARWTVRHFELPPRLRVRLAVGSVALALLLAAELTVVIVLRGSTLAEYVSSRDPISGTVYLIMLGIFAAWPALVGERTKEKER